MARTLQERDYKNSKYVRPNQPWVCGWASEGHPCEVGPDGRGRCRATAECRPVMIGDRFVCTRSELQGGKCSDGPLPDGSCCTKIVKCHPVRSWRAKRKAMGYWLTALTVGIILLFVGGVNPASFVDPGPLTFQHSQVKDCAGCHTAFKDGASSWPHKAFAESSESVDSKLCVGCHQFGTDSFAPHSISKTQLASLSKSAAPASSNSMPWIPKLASVTMKPNADGAELFCMTCHQEHHGAGSDLKKMSNQRCQACHTSAFKNLSNGHPSFGKYPYERRTRIQFDHTSHIGNHFVEKKYKAIAPTECKTCHEPDIMGDSMSVVGFEKPCAACHLDQIQGEGRATAKGIAIFAVPGLDVATLREKNVGIGQWPEDPDGGSTPFMEFLLAGNSDYKAAKKTLGDIDFMDLGEATKPQLKAIENYAWAIKGLLFDLATEGVPAFGKMLEASMGRKLSNTELGLLTGLIQPDAVLGAQRAWFPKLFADVTKHRDGEVVPVPAEEDSPTGGSGKDDILVAAKDDILSGGKDDILSGKKDDILSGGKDDILSGKKDDILSGGKDDILSGKKDDILSGGKDDILSGGKKDDILGGKKEDILGGGKQEDILGGGKKEDILGGGKQEDILGGSAPKEGESKAAKAEKEEEPDVEIAPGEEWASAGGWYRDEFTLRYRPAGHADTMMRSWLDAAGGAASMEAKESAGQILSALTKKGAPGLCVKCHSVDEESSGKFVFNWKGHTPKSNSHTFTKYSHTAHFSLLDEKGCLDCHTLNKKAKYKASFKDRNPKSFEGNFNAIKRETCAACHTQDQAGSDCLICHNYHVGKFGPALTSTPMAEGMK